MGYFAFEAMRSLFGLQNILNFCHYSKIYTPFTHPPFLRTNPSNPVFFQLKKTSAHDGYVGLYERISEYIQTDMTIMLSMWKGFSEEIGSFQRSPKILSCDSSFTQSNGNSKHSKQENY